MSEFLNLTVGPAICEVALLRNKHSDVSESERQLELTEYVELVLNTTQAAMLMKELAELLSACMQEEYASEGSVR